jgi:hypothetical protein
MEWTVALIDQGRMQDIFRYSQFMLICLMFLIF